MSESSKPRLTGAFDLFTKSKDLVMKNGKMFAILYALPFLSLLGDLTKHGRLDRGETRFISNGFGGLPTPALAGLLGFGFILSVIAIIIAFLIRAMTYTLELESAERQTPSLKHLYNRSRKYIWRLIGLMFTIGLMVIGVALLFLLPALLLGIVTSSLVAIRVLLAIVGAVIGIYCVAQIVRRYFLAPYVLIDKNMGIADSLAHSSKLSNVQPMAIWSILGVMFLIGLLNVIPIVGPLAAFFLGIAYSVAPAIRYTELR